MFLWAALEKNIPFMVNFVFAILIARLVSPDAYGLVAMTAILTALATVIQNMGLTSALIQREELSENDTTTVFVANVILGGIVALLLIAFSGQIAQFFDRDEIVSVVHVNAAALLLAALGTVQMAMLQRNYRFRAGLAIEVSVSFLSGGSAIVMALSGYGLWALLIMILVREASRTILLWTLIRWWPRGIFSTASLRELWSYARHMIGASLYHHFATNLTSLLLGKFYSATVLGLFSRAQSLQTLPVGLVTQPVQRVAFPLYSRHQSDWGELRRLLRIHIRSVALLAGVITAGLATCAREIVLILVGETWSASIPMLQTLSLAAFFGVTFPLHSEANKAIGASRWFFWIEVAKKTFLVALIGFGINLGLTWLLWALVISSFVDYLLSATSSARFLGYSWRAQIADLAPALGLTIIAIGLAELATNAFNDPGLWGGLVVQGGIVLVVFAGGIALFGARSFPEVHAQWTELRSRTLRRVARF